MDWENERYVRLYTRDTVEWEMLPWQARALWPLLLRKVDRIGYLPLGRHGAKGLAALVKLPPDVVEVGLEGLLEDGCIVKLEEPGGEVLFVPNFVPAQEARQSDKARKEKQRELERAKALARSRGVQPPDDTGRAVTSCDDMGHRVTDRDQPSRSVTAGHKPGQTATTRDQLSRSGTAGHKSGQNVTTGHTVSHGVTPSLAVLKNPPTPLSEGGSPPEDDGAEESSEVTRIAARVTARIVEITGRPYPIAVELERRIREGATEDELLRVVECKAADPWFRERHFARFKPSTLFGRKYPEYLAEATPMARQASGLPEGYRGFSEWD